MESWQENFRIIISSGVCAKSAEHYSQMEYEHNFVENFKRFYCTTLYFYCLNILLLYKLLYYVYNIISFVFAMFCFFQ